MIKWYRSRMSAYPIMKKKIYIPLTSWLKDIMKWAMKEIWIHFYQKTKEYIYGFNIDNTHSFLFPSILIILIMMSIFSIVIFVALWCRMLSNFSCMWIPLNDELKPAHFKFFALIQYLAFQVFTQEYTNVVSS